MPHHLILQEQEKARPQGSLWYSPVSLGSNLDGIFMCAWIDTMSSLRSGFFGSSTGFLEVYVRISAKRKSFTLPFKTVIHAPEFAIGERKVDIQPSTSVDIGPFGS